MRIAMVADNSVAANWGCRGTSFALRSMLAERGEISGVITRYEIIGRLAHSPLVPNRIYGAAADRVRKRSLPMIGTLMAGIGEFTPWSLDLDANAAALAALRGKARAADIIFDAIENADIVVVNGEGEMIFSDPPRQGLLATMTIMKIALDAGKPVHYLNAMISPSHAAQADRSATEERTLEVAAGLLARCTVGLRDPLSMRVAAKLMPEVETHYRPDALFSWAGELAFPGVGGPVADRIQPLLDQNGVRAPKALSGDYLVVSGSSAAANVDRGTAIDAYCRLVEKLRGLGPSPLLIPTCTGDNFLHEVARRTGVESLPVTTPIMAGAMILANASAMVSGRWHPSIMASLGGTPTVMLGSNSHKTSALLEMLPYDHDHPFGTLPTEQESIEIRDLLSQEILAGTDRRAEIAAHAATLGREARTLMDLVDPRPVKATA